MFPTKNKNSQEGFTLIELMVVVAVIGILSAMLLPKLTSAQESARTARVLADLRAIDTAIVAYTADNGEEPKEIDDLKNYFVGEIAAPAGTIKLGGVGGKALSGNYSIEEKNVGGGMRAKITVAGTARCAEDIVAAPAPPG